MHLNWILFYKLNVSVMDSYVSDLMNDVAFLSEVKFKYLITNELVEIKPGRQNPLYLPFVFPS